jgi:hypothetical protein
MLFTHFGLGLTMDLAQASRAAIPPRVHYLWANTRVTASNVADLDNLFARIQLPDLREYLNHSQSPTEFGEAGTYLPNPRALEVIRYNPQVNPFSPYMTQQEQYSAEPLHLPLITKDGVVETFVYPISCHIVQIEIDVQTLTSRQFNLYAAVSNVS